MDNKFIRECISIAYTYIHVWLPGNSTSASTPPDADRLGADLDCAQDLYSDLQALYKGKLL